MQVAEGQWLHMDYRAEIWWGSILCVWAALFWEALLTLELGKGLEKVAQTKPTHINLASLPHLAGCPFPVVGTKSKSRIWSSPHGTFKLYWIMKILIAQRDALHLLLMYLKTITWTLQLFRSQGLPEKACFGKRKDDTHSSGLVGLIRM